MPLAPGQKVAVGPPAKPEHIPAGLPPTVPKLGGTSNRLGGTMKNALSGLGGSQRAYGAMDDMAGYIEMPDGSKALVAWLNKKTSLRNALGMKHSW